LRSVLQIGFQSFEILEWDEEDTGEEICQFRDRVSAYSFLRSLLHDSLSMVHARRILATISSSWDISRLNDHQVLEQLALQLVSGRFTIRRIPAFEMGPSSAKPLPEVSEPEQAPEIVHEKEEKVWIEIMLVDETNHPVAGERFRILLPNGKKVEGKTDSRGMARVDNIDPGTCQVTFPYLDREAWERA
jgi:hypothetical protein